MLLLFLSINTVRGQEKTYFSQEQIDSLRNAIVAPLSQHDIEKYKLEKLGEQKGLGSDDFYAYPQIWVCPDNLYIMIPTQSEYQDSNDPHIRPKKIVGIKFATDSVMRIVAFQFITRNGPIPRWITIYSVNLYEDTNYNVPNIILSTEEQPAIKFWFAPNQTANQTDSIYQFVEKLLMKREECITKRALFNPSKNP